MKKRSNREAYEKRKGRINASAMSRIEGENINNTPETPAKAEYSPPNTVTPQKEKEPAIKQPPRSSVTDAGKERPAAKAPRLKSATRPRKKGATGKAVVIGGIIVILAILLFAALYSAFGGKEPFNASFTFNSATATLGEEAITMDNSIYVDDGTAMAPLDGLAEVLPVTVKMKEGSDKATVKGNGVKVKINFDAAQVEVNGEKQDWPAAPIIKDNVPYVPLVAFCEAFGYDTAYAGSISRVFVFMPDDKNKAPTAEFSTNKDTYAIGETVEYTADAQDPDGDEIVEWTWTNHQDYFEEPGEVTITLTVMDCRGAVSDEVSKTITIVEDE